MLLAQQLVNGLVLGADYALVAVGLTIIYGVLNILNFAHGEFVMLGALTIYILGSVLGFSYWLASLISVGVVFLIGVLLQRALLSRIPEQDHLNALLLTFAVSTFVVAATDLALGPTPREISSNLERPLQIGSVFVSGQKLLALGVGLTLIWGLHLFLHRTKWGRMIRATSQNTVGAAVCGLHMKAVRYWTFGLGSALAAVAGVLMGPSVYFTPSMGQNLIIKAFVIVVLGGMGSITGTAVAAFFLGVVEMLAGMVFPGGFNDIIAFAVLILTLIVRPKGFVSKTI